LKNQFLSRALRIAPGFFLVQDRILEYHIAIMETQNITATHPSKVLKWLLILGIVIILNLFFVYGIKVFYNAPAFENFCPVSQVNTAPATEAECVAVGGGWTSNLVPVQPTPKGAVAPNIAVEPAGYCNVNFTCQKEFTAANSLYDRNVFVALVILGVLSLIAGFFIRKSSAVSIGLSLGGVLALVVGSVRYWSDMNDYLRFGVLALALIILVVLGIKKVRE
jgi:hypothetical protein